MKSDGWKSPRPASAASTKEKKTISTIFSEQGEEAFREMETACIKSLFAQKQEHVIAVGGGNY